MSRLTFAEKSDFVRNQVKRKSFMKKVYADFPIFLLICLLFALFADIYLQTVNQTKVEEPIEIKYEAISPHQTGYEIPDLCGLESVVCDGEKNKRIVTATAYSSTVGQTDDTPCISADGSDICFRFHTLNEQICASNFLALGSEIFIKGYGTCIIRDRMAKRFSERVDIYFGQGDEAYKNALVFGKREIEITY